MLLLLYYLIACTIPTFAYPNYIELQSSVENYLSKNRGSLSNSNWIPNSNFIGMGYDPVQGSPVCYTGSCQMDGMKAPIFDLQYTSWKPGACTDLTVPANTQLLCLPITTIDKHTEEISTLSQLRQSTSSAIDVGVTTGVWGKLLGFFGSYGYSKQTTYMVDTLTQKNQSIFHTTTDVTFAKLTMFEPMMQLSDNFRFVIENMPCCYYDSDTKNYIKTYIFDYFGFAYLKEILLGGIVQEMITIESQRYKELKSKGLQTQHCVSAGFLSTIFGANFPSSSTTTTQEEFRQSLTTKRISQLGGNQALVSKPIQDWIASVPNNPIVMKFKIGYLSDLITTRRFPNDRNIATKLSLINQGLEDYIRNIELKACPRGCLGPYQGTCQRGDLNVPFCKCNPPYTGADCSIDMRMPPVPKGTTCGYASYNTVQITCDGANPSIRCPFGYLSVCFDDKIFEPNSAVCTCYKNQTDGVRSKRGTICGIHKYCGGRHILNEGCPTGYLFEGRSVLCYKNDATIDDASGTACGYAAPKNSCGNDGTQTCPSGYERKTKSNGDLYYCSKS